MGRAIIVARKGAFEIRQEVAEIIGICQETLKVYEQGTRTLPFDVFYKSVQFLGWLWLFRFGVKSSNNVIVM